MDLNVWANVFHISEPVNLNRGSILIYIAWFNPSSLQWRHTIMAFQSNGNLTVCSKSCSCHNKERSKALYHFVRESTDDRYNQIRRVMRKAVHIMTSSRHQYVAARYWAHLRQRIEWNGILFSANHCITLTHWGWVTHICVSELTIIGSDNGLSPGRRQAIIWTSAGILLIGPLGHVYRNSYNFIQENPFENVWKWRPFCLGLNVLRHVWTSRPTSSLLQMDWCQRGDRSSTNIMMTDCRLGNSSTFVRGTLK